jgi:DNA-binding transcriptional ArsR family regulator
MATMIVGTTAQALALKAKLFRGFADGSRLAILEALRQGPLTVGEIVEATGLSQPNASNHLACLHDCGLVAREQQGRFVHYRLSDGRVDDLLSRVDELLTDVARGVYDCVRYRGTKGK